MENVKVRAFIPRGINFQKLVAWRIALARWMNIQAGFLFFQEIFFKA